MAESYLKMQGLENILKALKAKPPIARVGVLGNSNAREGKVNSNAQVGAAHEFGTTSLPMRSFLRVPITEQMQNALDESGAFTKKSLKEVIETKSMLPWVQKIAVLAEGIVLEAFDTGGFGKWRPSDMSHKKVKQTLVESQQLRNSITSEVKESA